jgi:hypothetical protein
MAYIRSCSVIPTREEKRREERKDGSSGGLGQVHKWAAVEEKGDEVVSLKPY